MAMNPISQLDIELDNVEAMALAQFVKRIGWRELRQNAVDDEEAYLMQGSVSKLQNAMANAGYAPR